MVGTFFLIAVPGILAHILYKKITGKTYDLFERISACLFWSYCIYFASIAMLMVFGYDMWNFNLVNQGAGVAGRYVLFSLVFAAVFPFVGKGLEFVVKKGKTQ